MSFRKTPLTSHLGVEITGIDLAADLGTDPDSTADEGAGGNLFGDLKQAWLDAGGMMVIRDQTLTRNQHMAFSRRFGPLFHDPGQPPLQDTVSRYLHPDHPQIYRVSNKVDEQGEPLGRARAGTYWHSDVSFRDRPAGASVLYGIEVPDHGGDTIFANMTAAYAALSDGFKAILDGLEAVHDFAVAAATQYAQPLVIEGDFDGANRSVHPVVRTHGETGRKSLYVNPGFTSHLKDFSAEESKAILQPLYDFATRPEFLYRHRWRSGDVVVWDNRCLMHYAIKDYTADRYMERCTAIGERPV